MSEELSPIMSVIDDMVRRRAQQATPLITPERAALIEAQKALACAQRKINEALGRT